VQRVIARVEHLASHPRAGVRPSELPRSRHRQVVEPPCRVFYRVDGKRVLILHVMRGERLLAPGKLDARHGRGR
jgi:plasmid stabilization system protein ParE